MPAERTFFVISDQHLGGSPAADGQVGFEMCPKPNREHLARFIDYVRDQHGRGRPAQLIIAGDLVDFLAERTFASFTASDDEARKKLEAIMCRTEEVWNSLEHLARSGVRLTILLGNHDIEMSLPGPRRVLLDRLGPGRVEFIYDNQAFRDGPVLIEHGNRYDPWNVVSHHALRRIRSVASRGEDPVAFAGPPGSQLVARVINGIKETYSFVDLLKPEEAGVLPLLAVLHPASLGDIHDVRSNDLTAWRRQVPTFVRIDLVSDRVDRADVYFFDEGKEPEPVPDRPLARLVY